MTPRQAALDFAASLLEQQLARAHCEGNDYSITGRAIIADTFELAPPNVLAAIERGLDKEAVGEEMARLAGDLRAVKGWAKGDPVTDVAAVVAAAFGRRLAIEEICNALDEIDPAIANTVRRKFE